MSLKLLKEFQKLVLTLRDHFRKRMNTTEIKSEQEALEIKTEDVKHNIVWSRS